ncbi:MAG: hypothetical protein US11_C0004G0042 [Candidatus Roizmanbacteria bacterium GW2011_GWA2_36_23]|uniref:Uncharacterized protein n=1 Tax=Candidatus Roizmanbacteria bacterium GW2011_GWA2_36_23 TaxID=1618480 RepID=A0A0G0E8B7_9BACT|nr:MAG: hypothetical protein US11_C0004G0042 [Candidatus Roizmanbacteria bacterium GW2011_GWA2_36_23]
MLISIPIPKQAKLLVKIGQKLDFSIPLYENKTEKLMDINLSRKLGIKPANIFRYLKKFVGENINPGDIVASKSNFFSTQKVLSEYDGNIKEIDHIEGKMIIMTKVGEESKTYSCIKGIVAEVNKNDIKITVKDGKEFPIKNASISFGGEVYYLSPLEDSSILESNIQNKIVLTEMFSSYFQSKTEALGTKGFVSLMNLPDISDLPHAQLKRVEDFKIINNLHLPYCFINSERSIIVFYL